ncbi:MAG TPA: hypothetical protein VHU88_02515 [Sporichthyaceae bacterium]|jgi:hypothetical protein|nr:hypothetical protein [Sporichthyaceae bacterium]
MQFRGKVVALHIGAHKTATSVVQHWLNQNQELHRPAGLQYLRRDELSRMIGWGERLVADPAPLAARLARFHADPRFRTLIGSYENVLGRPFPGGGDGRLYPNAERNIQALDRALGRSRCRILLSIRPQPDFVESYYLQSVHQGGWKTFSAWVKSVDLDQLSWQPAVDALHATFGRDRVEVLDFRQIKQGDRAWMEHFLHRVDPTLAVPIGEGRGNHNRSVSGRGLDIALAVNQHLQTQDERHALRRFLQKHFSNVDSPRPVLFDPAEKARLWERYGPEYERLVAWQP